MSADSVTTRAIEIGREAVRSNERQLNDALSQLKDMSEEAEALPTSPEKFRAMREVLTSKRIVHAFSLLQRQEPRSLSPFLTEVGRLKESENESLPSSGGICLVSLVSMIAATGLGVVGGRRLWTGIAKRNAS